jgi:hypothetical protein
MVTTREGAVSADAIRAYIRTLRLEQQISQLSRRAYLDWETGKSKEAKTSPLLRAVRFLSGSPDDLAAFEDSTTPEEAAKVAHSRLNAAQQRAITEAVGEGLAEEDVEWIANQLRERMRARAAARGVKPPRE